MTVGESCINIGDDLDVTVTEAQRIIKWMTETPEGKLFIRHLNQQIDIAEDRADSPIGDNPIKELLMRERMIAVSLTLKSIVKWPADIAIMIEQEMEHRKDLTNDSQS